MPSENPFWDYSLAVYRRPGVAEACLRLQDGAGVDVNLLLYFCWLAAARDTPLDEIAIRDAMAHTEAWRERVVRPLREIRRWMKGGAGGLPPERIESLRSEVKRIELHSERLQQDMLFEMTVPAAAAEDGAAARQRAERGIAIYLALIGAQPTESVVRDYRAVIAAGAPVQR